ncbi:MAG: hypothetical protein PUC96_00490 [Bacteroidales bacterium]|nr:hypothetical protein [Bacteroidales bacterium]
MKKILKSIAVLAVSALAMVSCQKELLGPAVQEGQEVAVSIDLTTPLMGTKSYADGQTVDVVHVHVYQQDSERNLTYIAPNATTATPSKDVTMTGGTATYSTRLVTGQTYTFVFWAEKKDNGAYTYDPATKTISVDYSNAAGNDEKRDAFYAVLKGVEITGAYSASVTLNRPFAQLNFGVTNEDYAAAEAAGIHVTGAAVKVTGVANTLNLLDGTVTGDVDVEFASASLPRDPNGTLTAAGVGYKYVAMDYVLVGKNGKTLSDVTLALDVNGTTSTRPEYTYSNVPLQGNYRTNIVGSLFTSPADINITVDPAWSGDHDVPFAATVNGATYTTIESAFAAATHGETITLVSDVQTAGITVPAGAETVLDLAGKKITATATPSTRSNSGEIAFTVLGKLTITGDGKVDGGEGGNNVAVKVFPGGKAIINGGYFTVGADANGVGNSCIETAGGDVVINGGYFRTEAAYNGFYYVLNQVNSNPGTIQVTGGKFENYDPVRGDDNLLGTFIASGYTSKKISDNPAVYEVGPAPAVTVATAAELKTMLTNLTSANAGDNVVELTADIQLAEGEHWESIDVQGYHGAGVITVKGNGHSISGLDAPLFAGGFAGESGIAIHDLTLTNVNINDNSNTLGVGAFVGSVDSMNQIELLNCKLTNSTIFSTAGARVGGLIGWTAGYNNPNDGPVTLNVTVKGCIVEDCDITAAGSLGAIIGHAGNNPATNHYIENCTVTNCNLHSTDDGGWRVGVVVGTANEGKVDIKNITESGNTLTQVGKTAPEHSNLYGRFVPNETGKLYIDGVEITQ